MDLAGYLESRILGGGAGARRVAVLAARGLSGAGDARALVVRGLERVEGVVLARPYTRHGWLLAIYHSIGMTRDGYIIVYYNSGDPRWTASALVHEAVHAALDSRPPGPLGFAAEEALAYAASFKAGFHRLYLEGIRQAAGALSRCASPYAEHELASVVVPRLLAHRLAGVDLEWLAGLALQGGLEALLGAWLDSSPSEAEVRALAAALAVLGVDPGLPRLRPPCGPEPAAPGPGLEEGLEGVDEGFLGMLRVLWEAARDKRRAREVLRPWLGELEGLEHELEAYLELYGGPEARG